MIKNHNPLYLYSLLVDQLDGTATALQIFCTLMALSLQTRSTEGVLFYGYSQTEYNHLAVSLHNSSLHVSVVFIDQTNYDELWMALGANLHDDR